MFLYSKINVKNPFSSLLKGPVNGADFIGKVKEINFFPFEGPLIRWAMIDLLALPKKDYFIICDDLEYSYRVQSVGGRAGLCGSALMRRQILPKHSINFDWKNYYDFRNRVFFDMEHAGFVFAIIRGVSWMARQVILSVFRRRDLMSFKILIVATIHGIFNIKMKHNEIMKISTR
jgi:GT2 family glycosyltransferase